MKKNFYLLFLLPSIISSFSFGASHRMTNALPSGIIFPYYNDSISLNPSGLTIEKTRGFHLRHTPNLGGDKPSQTYGSIAASTKGFGLGLGYQNDSLDGVNKSALEGATSFRIGDIAIGLRAHNDDLTDRANNRIEFDVSALYTTWNNLNAGFVYRSLGTNDQQLEGGLGYAVKDQYSVEWDVLFPKDMASGDYYLTLAGAMYFKEKFGASYKMGLRTLNNSFKHTLGGLYWIAEEAHLFAEYELPNRIALGLTLVF